MGAKPNKKKRPGPLGQLLYHIISIEEFLFPNIFSPAFAQTIRLDPNRFSVIGGHVIQNIFSSTTSEVVSKNGKPTVSPFIPSLMVGPICKISKSIKVYEIHFTPKP